MVSVSKETGEYLIQSKNPPGCAGALMSFSVKLTKWFKIQFVAEAKMFKVCPHNGWRADCPRVMVTSVEGD